MSVYLLPVDDADGARLAELLHAVGAASLLRDTPAVSDGSVRWRVVAVSDCGVLVGYGATGRDRDMEPGRFWLYLLVDTAYRRQGIGAMLYDDIARFAWEMGATYLTADIPSDHCGALAFARRRGFHSGADGDMDGAHDTVDSGSLRLRLNIAAGVPSSPREAVKARYREFRFEQALLEARS